MNYGITLKRRNSIRDNKGKIVSVDEYLSRKLEIYVSSIFKRYLIFKFVNSKDITSQEKLERIKEVVECGPSLTSQVFSLEDVDTKSVEIRRYHMMYGVYDFDDFGASYKLVPVVIDLPDVLVEEKARFVLDVLMQQDMQDDSLIVVLEHYEAQMNAETFEAFSEEDKELFGRIILSDLLNKRIMLKQVPQHFDTFLDLIAKNLGVDLNKLKDDLVQEEVKCLQDNDNMVSNNPDRLNIYQRFLEWLQVQRDKLKSFGRDDS